jgi:D-sedoheptulose 7-phosphate isomerase
MARSILNSIDEAARVLEVFRGDAELQAKVALGAHLLARCTAGGHKILICGNGGSACDAMHFAEEMTGRFRGDRRPLAALACTDVGHITCTANDYGFEYVYSRWVEALARSGDRLVVLSTSGNSANLVRAVEIAHAGGIKTIGLLGRGGGALAGLCDLALVFPGETSDRIQELHMLVLHAWVEAIEGEVVGE